MASAPAGLTTKRNRDLEGLATNLWIRRALIAALTLFVVAGLFNLFGQRPSETAAVAPDATLEVKAPTRVRSGLLYELRITVAAGREIRDAHVVLGRGWLDGITVNTIEPAPIGEASRDGALRLRLGRVPAGDRHILWIQAQVNPTTVARRTAGVELLDGDRLLARVERGFTVLP